MEYSTAVITDSLACLPPALAAEYRITIVPLSFIFKDKVYRDWVDITPTQAYELFLKSPDLFHSSTPSPSDFLEAFRSACSYASKIICITLGDKLSTTFNAARSAKDLAIKELPEIHINIFNTRTTGAAEGFIALGVARAIAGGKSFEEALQIAEEIKKKVVLIASLNTIRHVYRSGRIPKIASQIGSMLHVKPLLGITPESDGLVNFFGISRSQQNGIDRMLKAMRDRVGNNRVHVAVIHAYAPQEAEKLKETIAASFDCTELWITEFSPLMGYTIGTGALGLCFYPEIK